MSIEDEGGEAAPEGGPLDHFRTIAAELERNRRGGAIVSIIVLFLKRLNTIL